MANTEREKMNPERCKAKGKRKPRIRFILLMIGLFLTVLVVSGERLDTIQDGWRLLDSASASETALAYNMSKWDQVRSANTSILSWSATKIPTAWNFIVLRFRANDSAASGVAVVYIAAEGGDFEKVCTITLTAATGNAKEATFGGVYFESGAIASQDWVIGGGPDIVDENADDGTMKVFFDRCYAGRIVVLFTTVSSEDTIYCDVIGY